MSRLLAAVAFCVPVLLSTVSRSVAIDCPMGNPPEILDTPYHLVYGSWVEPTDGGFRYGRCVAVKNGQSARIDWQGTQLNGIAEPDFPAQVELDFTVDEREDRPSELRYGIDSVPDRGKTVNFVANVGEVSGEVAMVTARVTEWKIRAIAGETVERRILRPASDVALAFSAGDASFRLRLRFESLLDLANTYEYRLSYTLSGGSAGTEIRIAPRSEFLRSALARSDFSDGFISLRANNEPNEIAFSLQVEGVDPRERRTTQGLAVFDVIGGGETVASFPVSFYFPSGAGG